MDVPIQRCWPNVLFVPHLLSWNSDWYFDFYVPTIAWVSKTVHPNVDASLIVVHSTCGICVAFDLFRI